ncbi:MAG: hypothetical protein WCL07_00720 [bacterium]
MNDDQIINPTTNLNPTTPVVPVEPVTVEPQTTIAEEPIKLDEFGVEVAAVATVTPTVNQIASTTVDPITPYPFAAPTPIPVPETTPILEPATVVTTPAPQQPGEDLPLAFAGIGNEIKPITDLPQSKDEIVNIPAPLPPVEAEVPKKKGLGSKIIVKVLIGVAILGSVIGGGWYAYDYYSTAATIAKLSTASIKADLAAGNISKDEAKTAQKVVDQREKRIDNAPVYNDGNKGQYENATGLNPTLPENQAGFQNYMVEKQSGNANPIIGVNDCNADQIFCGDGGGFCLNKNENKTCIQSATEKGITVVSGYLLCTKNESGNWVADASKYVTGANLDAENANCSVADGADNGSLMTQCKPDVVGACTEANGDIIKSMPSCFCGTIQVDLGTSGHRSYKGSCGCGTADKTSTTASTPPSSTPPTSATPTLACTQLIKDKADSAIAIGTKITLTCSGSTAPAGAATLTYKFRYSVNSGTPTSLTNVTTTTAAITPDRCGTYSVECQACGTINNAVVCDPVWSAASAQ